MTERRETLRNPALGVTAVVGAAVLAWFALTSADTAGAALYWTAAVLALLSRVPSLKVTPEGLIVCNVWPRSYRWDEITGLEGPRHRGMLLLHVAGGETKRVWAIGIFRAAIGSRWTHQTVRRIRARWERATGRPVTRDYSDLS